VLYRLYPHRQGVPPLEEGGPLHVPRAVQGAGRHDNPDRYGALYVSRTPVSVVAEHLRRFTDRPVTDRFLQPEPDVRYAVAALHDESIGELLDLDDPRTLDRRGFRPSRVATRDREVTQEMALTLYEEGLSGLEWWSTIEASWINVTLFAERAVGRLALSGEPEPLSTSHPAVREAAEVVGVLLA
jgi:RES domain